MCTVHNYRQLKLTAGLPYKQKQTKTFVIESSDSIQSLLKIMLLQCKVIEYLSILDHFTWSTGLLG